MITYVKGKLVEKEPTHVIIETGGLGYHVNISLNTYSAVKDQEDCKLFTHFHVKEDSQTLYGFSIKAERQTFRDLISISGVGPSTGLMILSSLSPKELQNAIATEDVKTIQSVKGIGAKTAQRIILELKGKIEKSILDGSIEVDSSVRSHNTIKDDALIALTTLGIAKAVAEKSVEKVIRRLGMDITVEELIKQALKTA